jgi:hypothetical protein
VSCSPLGAFRNQETPDGKKSKLPGWETKACDCCDCTPKQPTDTDRAEGRALRKWAVRNYYSRFCWWCVRASAVRYAHFRGTSSALQKYISDNPANKAEARIAAYAYVSLRDEGRVQIDLKTLMMRVRLLMSAAEAIPCFGQSFVTTLLTSFTTTGGDNAVLLQYPIVQMLVDGKLRLGVRCPLFSTAVGAAARGVPLAVMSPNVMTEDPSDLVLLENLAKQAAQEIEEKGRAAAASQAIVKAEHEQDDGDDHDGPHPTQTTPSTSSAARQFEYPKGRLGNNVKRMQLKVDALLYSLTAELWRGILKENGLRSNLRVVSGLGAELEASTFPQLISINATQQKVISLLLTFSSALHAQAKNDDLHLWLPFKGILDALNVHLIKSAGPEARFDVEVQLLAVLLWINATNTGVAWAMVPLCPQYSRWGPLRFLSHQFYGVKSEFDFVRGAA